MGTGGCEEGAGEGASVKSVHSNDGRVVGTLEAGTDAELGPNGSNTLMADAGVPVGAGITDADGCMESESKAPRKSTVVLVGCCWGARAGAGAVAAGAGAGCGCAWAVGTVGGLQ